jgi:hypothetical protein
LRARQAPARYGLHATLKAPFRLRQGWDASSLQQALDAFCASRRGPCGGALMPATFQSYLGLVLSGQTADIDWLATECVTHFDTFRAPLDESDRDRRAHASLTGQEQAFLQTFGYPYVLSAFQFHVSLAGPLDAGELETVAAALQAELSPLLSTPVRIGSLSLVGEPEGRGTFALLSRHTFR